MSYTSPSSCGRATTSKNTAQEQHILILFYPDKFLLLLINNDQNQRNISLFISESAQILNEYSADKDKWMLFIPDQRSRLRSTVRKMKIHTFNECPAYAQASFSQTEEEGEGKARNSREENAISVGKWKHHTFPSPSLSFWHKMPLF